MDGHEVEEEHVDAQQQFEAHDAGPLAEEARTRWGDTPQWAESQRRTAAMTAAEKREVVVEQQRHVERLAAAFTAGVAPEDPTAHALAEEGRQLISDRFYECSPQQHVALAGMYESDERFRRHYDRHAPGLAAWWAAAIRASASA